MTLQFGCIHLIPRLPLQIENCMYDPEGVMILFWMAYSTHLSFIWHEMLPFHHAFPLCRYREWHSWSRRSNDPILNGLFHSSIIHLTWNVTRLIMHHDVVIYKRYHSYYTRGRDVNYNLKVHFMINSHRGVGWGAWGVRYPFLRISCKKMTHLGGTSPYSLYTWVPPPGEESLPLKHGTPYKILNLSKAPPTNMSLLVKKTPYS